MIYVQNHPPRPHGRRDKRKVGIQLALRISLRKTRVMPPLEEWQTRVLMHDVCTLVQPSECITPKPLSRPTQSTNRAQI